jgi:apolipoprotein N-acyltransferase
MWGLTFMITWFASVANWAYNHYADGRTTKKGILVYAVIFMMVLAYGSIRLLMPLPNDTVRIAGIHTTDKEKGGKEFWKALAKKDTIRFHQLSRVQINSLTAATVKEANAGAKIILWSEVSPTILKRQEDRLMIELKNLALQLKIYLIANPYSATIDDTKPENKLWIFSPQGELVFTHYKYGGNFMEGSAEGDQQLKIIHTPFGNLSGIICWDADFPAVVTQVGLLNADIVFNPASDWKEIDPLHTVVATFRGIENGCSWVRQTRNGLSVMTDPRGKIISSMDHFKTGNWVNKGDVPTKKIGSLYPIIGDLFGWIAITALILLTLVSCIRERKK